MTNVDYLIYPCADHRDHVIDLFHHRFGAADHHAACLDVVDHPVVFSDPLVDAFDLPDGAVHLAAVSGFPGDVGRLAVYVGLAVDAADPAVDAADLVVCADLPDDAGHLADGADLLVGDADLPADGVDLHLAAVDLPVVSHVVDAAPAVAAPDDGVLVDAAPDRDSSVPARDVAVLADADPVHAAAVDGALAGVDLLHVVFVVRDPVGDDHRHGVLYFAIDRFVDVHFCSDPLSPCCAVDSDNFVAATRADGQHPDNDHPHNDADRLAAAAV